MRITVNLDDAAVELLDASAEAHHESRAEFAGLLLESQLTSQNKIHDKYIQELNQREQMIKRLTGEVQDLRRLLDEARARPRNGTPSPRGRSGRSSTGRISGSRSCLRRSPGWRVPSAGHLRQVMWIGSKMMWLICAPGCRRGTSRSPGWRTWSGNCPGQGSGSGSCLI